MIAQPAPAPSLFDGVRERLDALVPIFGLDRTRATVTRAYELLCGDALDVPLGRRPMRPSRLNADGTPFQVALALGPSKPPLQFVTETGSLDATNAEGLVVARDRIRRVAGLFGAAASLPFVFSVLDKTAPADDPELLTDHAGAVWLGAAFPPDRSPRLKVYVNAKWGGEGARWKRLAQFAELMRVTSEWNRLRGLAPRGLEPLGVSVTVCRDGPAAGRIYLKGYGERFPVYEALARAQGGPGAARRIRGFARTLLGNDDRHPSRAAVCSFGVHAGACRDFKLELCAHCAFDSDARAGRACVDWLLQTGVPPELYLRVTRLLAGGRLSNEETRLHSYVGIGLDGGASSSTIYLNPAAGFP